MFVYVRTLMFAVLLFACDSRPDYLCVALLFVCVFVCFVVMYGLMLSGRG